MSRDTAIVELGDAEATPDIGRGIHLDEELPPLPLRGGGPPAPTRRLTGLGQLAASQVAGLQRWPGLTRSLSLIVPGLGQVVRGQISHGLLWFCGTLFTLTLAWSILETLDRLVGTMSLLGYPVTAVFWLLSGIFLVTASLHLASALGAVRSDSPELDVVYHPVLPGLASAVLPGWGQLLNGDRFRGGLFLASAWIAGGIWLATSGPATALLSEYVAGVSSLEQTLREPRLLWAAQWTFPVTIWALAVYDAVSQAIWRR